MERSTSWRLMHRRPLSVLTALFVVGVAVILYNGDRAARRLVESKALLDAEMFSRAITDVRTIYTSEVVEIVQRRGIRITHDYRAHAGAIPLPATFSMLVGEAIGEHRTGHSADLYSPFPFPWRRDGGLRDSFAKDAWAALSKAPERPFYRFETVGEGAVLRYATADRMRSGCVGCHNTYPGTPRKGWKEGDLRGVLEVRLPMGRVQEQTRTELRSSFLIVSVAGLLGLGLLGAVLGRLRRTTDDLERTVSELRASHDALSTAHDELGTAHDELVVARDQALASARLQNEFLGNMSHELRTPLNAILGYTELVRDELTEAKNEEHVELLDRVHDAGHALLALIDQVLEVSRLEAGTVELEPRDFDVGEMVAALVASMGDMTRGGALWFEIDCPDDVGRHHGDERKIRRILETLLGNARRFTERGQIALRIRRERQDQRQVLRFDVEDAGIGIRDDQVEGLFLPFSQVDSSATRRFQGMGLGLTLARGLTERMGGTLSVRSELGKGSTFTVRLPVRPGPAQPSNAAARTAPAE